MSNPLFFSHQVTIYIADEAKKNKLHMKSKAPSGQETMYQLPHFAPPTPRTGGWGVGLDIDSRIILRPVPATRTGQAPSRQYRATPSVLNIISSRLPGVFVRHHDPSLTSEGLAMPVPSLGSAVGSGVTCGSP